MKQYWERIVLKIDARTLRERTIIFITAILILIMVVNVFLLGPQFAKQSQLSQGMKQDQAKITQIQTEIQSKTKAQAFDPDAENRKHLQTLKQRLAQMHGSLRDMQKGLVSPDKMAELLEGILKRNTKLRLVSLKTLPASGLNESSAIQATDKLAQIAAVTKEKTVPKPATDAVYTHGVEITVQGSYPEIMGYLAELETMPWQLFWSKAKFNVDEYPTASLTLTLYTLSLDKNWLNI
jgi:MSHA biogenesis protein MshJ